VKSFLAQNLPQSTLVVGVAAQRATPPGVANNAPHRAASAETNDKADGIAQGARRAALLLHAMAPEDRAWVLEALPAAQRHQLASLLEELEALGIERDPSLIEEVTGAIPNDASRTETPRVNHSGPRNPDGEQSRDVPPLAIRLDALGPGEVLALARAFQREPAGVIADLLRLADMPWRQAFLAAFEPARRREIEEALDSRRALGPVAPRMRTALTQAALDAARAERIGPAWRTQAHAVKTLFQRAWLRVRHDRSPRR
jgi:hypothetical protein